VYIHLNEAPKVEACEKCTSVVVEQKELTRIVNR